MKKPSANRRFYQRPAKIQKYQKQLEFINAPERFVIIEATAKAGKTTGCMIWLLEQALKPENGGKIFWWLAPTYKPAKMVFDRLRRAIRGKHQVGLNRSELTITLNNEATIFFKTADVPDNLYGDDVMAVVIDEASRMKEEAWFAVNSVITATLGKVKIIGNVKGTLNWAYKLAREVEAGTKPGWSYFKITADDAVKAGVLKQEAIDAARANLPEVIFQELYYGKAFHNPTNKFCYTFNEAKHVGKGEYRPMWPLYLSFDFNYNPMCCSVYQMYLNTIWRLRTFKLPNSSIFALCDAIIKEYGNREFIVTGDSSGYAHNGIAGDNENCYAVIGQMLRVKTWYTPKNNPPLYDSGVRVNAYLEKFKVQIDPEFAADMITDLKYVEANPDGTIIKGNRNNPHQQADLLDSFRYFCCNIAPNVLPIPFFDKPG